MSINVSAYSIRKPIPSLVAFAVLLVLGAVSFLNMSVTRFPNIDVPVVQIRVIQPGAAPSELETQVAKKVEDAVASISGVKNIFSTLRDSSSVTTIEFRLEVNTDRAVNDVKDAVARIRQELPQGIEEPIVERVDVEGQAILTYSVAAPSMTLEQLSWFVDDTVSRKLQGLRSVGRVTRIGGVTREIRVDLNPDRLMALGITAGEVNRQLKAMNVDLAGGKGEFGGQEQAIRTLAGARTLHDLAATRIVLPGNREVTLGDLGTVTDGYEEPVTFSRMNGETPVVSFAIFRAKGASEITVKEGVAARVAEMAALRPDVTFTLIDDSVRYTVGNYKSAMMTLIEGALLAIAVVFFFLRDWRATLVAAIALPLSIIPTFFVMEMIGFSLNLVSLLAITLVTGILVDDAIVEIENIVRHMKMGKSPYRAAMEAADEIGLAVIAISLTIIAVFAPVSFMGGIAGQYFKQFGLTVAIAVFFSLLVARMLTPMMAAYFMRAHAPKEARDGWLMRGYTRFLAVTIRFRFLTLLAGVALFAASIWSTSLLPTGFIPPEDASRVVISVELPPGAKLEDTREKTDRIAQVLRGMPEVSKVLVSGGATPKGGRELRMATVVVVLVHKSERDRSQQQVQAEITRKLADIPDIRLWYVNERGERELQITLTGDDPVAFARAVGDLEAAMRRLPGFTNVAAEAGIDRPEIRIVPRLDEAARFGISTQAISEAVRVATIGENEVNLAQFNAGDRLIPIRVQMPLTARADLSTIESLTVLGPGGIPVPLTAVADVEFGQGPSSIERFNRVRRVIIGADLVGGKALGSALEQIYALPEASTKLPPGVRVQTTGDAEIMGEVFSGFAQAMGAGLMMVLGVLILLFGSVFQPITILLSLPLSIGGVIIALLLTGNPISMPVVIGILMLMGIVTKNAIMLVDFAVEEVARGVPRHEAIIDAGRKRARPIIMTTIAMVAGMVPAAYATGDGGEFRAPMAIAVIGGLIVSTVLSLIFVPSFYTVMDDLSRLTSRLFGRFVGPNEDEDAALAQARARHDAQAAAVPLAPSLPLKAAE
jgi:hydrophobe/amphiphile efflux-1 (HAE1) family protein